MIGIPESLVNTLNNMLIPDEMKRIDVDAVLKSTYLNDILVRVIRYLDKLLDKDVNSRNKFFKKLPEVISKFPSDIMVSKVIPPLILQMKDPNFVMSVLPSIFKITQHITPLIFQQYIQPTLSTYWISAKPPNVFFTICLNIDKIASRVTKKDLKEQIVPILGLVIHISKTVY